MHKLFNLVILFAVSFASYGGSCTSEHCIAIVDAGSSGSRIHLYSITSQPDQLPVFHEEWSNKINPGISSILFEQKSVDIYLNQLFSNAPDLQNIPLYFYATAGMRLQSQPHQALLYSLITNWFQSQPSWNLIEAKTITGHDEGLYGWLAVNYQLGNLSDKKEPVGVLDMGGASVQIAFPVKIKDDANSDIQSFNLNNRHYELFVHSFLGLGQNELTHQFLTVPECFANHYTTPDLPGNGDITECKKQIKPLINQVHHVNQLISENMSYKTNSQWFVIGGLTKLVSDSMINLGEVFTNKQLIEIADKQGCKKEWADILIEYPDNDYVYEDCLLAAYYYVLNINGYGLKPNEPIHYSHENSDWTIGVLLWQLVNSDKNLS